TVTVSTVVSVPDGGTVLLGGVKRLREGRNMAGVPILNKIPYISRLFKNTGVGRETDSLMLLVTPRIIINEEEEELLGIPGNYPNSSQFRLIPAYVLAPEPPQASPFLRRFFI